MMGPEDDSIEDMIGDVIEDDDDSFDYDERYDEDDEDDYDDEDPFDDEDPADGAF